MLAFLIDASAVKYHLQCLRIKRLFIFPSNKTAKWQVCAHFFCLQKATKQYNVRNGKPRLKEVNNMKKKIVKRIMVAAGALLLAGALLFALVFTGVVRWNTPSLEEYPVRGVDVSQYQGKIEWPILAAQNIQFAFVKATEGSSHVDPYFEANWAGAAEASVPVGAYHFFSFESTGEEQAHHFLQLMDNRTGNLPPVLDVELYGEYKANPPDAEELRAQLEDFLFYVEAASSQTPIIYTTQRTYKLYLQEGFSRFNLWIRDVYFTPAQQYQWTFWQYSDKGRLDGYIGLEENIDLNVYNGTEEEWAWFLELSKPKVICLDCA